MEQIQIMQQLADDRQQQADERADICRLEAEAARAEAHRRDDRQATDTRVAQLEARLQTLSQILPASQTLQVSVQTNASKQYQYFWERMASNCNLGSNSLPSTKKLTYLLLMYSAGVAMALLIRNIYGCSLQHHKPCKQQRCL